MKKPLVLIIEDDPMTGMVFQKTMQQAGFETNLDPDGNLYQQLIAENKPNFVILDMHLPYASGKEIMAEFQADSEMKDIPVLIVTADLYFVKELQAQYSNVLLKPVSPSKLLAVVKDIFPEHNVGDLYSTP